MRLARLLTAIPLAAVITATIFLAINAYVAPEPFVYTKPGEPTRIFLGNRIICDCEGFHFWIPEKPPVPDASNAYTRSEKATKEPPKAELPLHRDEDEIDRDLLSLDLGAKSPRACDGKDYIIDHMAPTYPAACAQKRAQGSVTIRYNISAEGKVQNAQIIESPDACFNKAVLTAVNKRRYPPVCNDNGKPYARYSIEEVMTFQLKE